VASDGILPLGLCGDLEDGPRKQMTRAAILSAIASLSGNGQVSSPVYPTRERQLTQFGTPVRRHADVSGPHPRCKETSHSVPRLGQATMGLTELPDCASPQARLKRQATKMCRAIRLSRTWVRPPKARYPESVTKEIG
jgi:hypothetical protein